MDENGLNGVNDPDDNIDPESLFNDIENDEWLGSNAEEAIDDSERWIGPIHSDDYQARLPPISKTSSAFKIALFALFSFKMLKMSKKGN